MTPWIYAFGFSTAFALAGCAPLVHELVPDKATAGQLQHAINGDGRLELTYGGKTYSGELEIEKSRRIHGKVQRHAGWTAQTVLLAPDGDSLSCDVQWANAERPAGVCTDTRGRSFDVRFDHGKRAGA